MHDGTEMANRIKAKHNLNLIKLYAGGNDYGIQKQFEEDTQIAMKMAHVIEVKKQYWNCEV